MQQLAESGAWACALASLVAWGSWPNFAKRSQSPWAVFYLIQAMGAGLVILLATGALCRCDPLASGWPVFWLSFASGGVCTTGVMLQLVAIWIDGMVLAVPVSNGVGVCLGTLALYSLERRRRETSPAWLFLGVGLVTAAIVLNAVSPALRDDKNSDDDAPDKDALLPEKPEPPVRRPGLLAALGAGLCFAAWPLLEDVVILDLGARLASDFLGPFAFGYVCTTFIVLPFVADELVFCPSKADALAALAAGATWAAGVVLLLLAGVSLGDAVAVAVAQCSPMVATLYGIFLWRELPIDDGCTREHSAVAAALTLFLLGILAFYVSTLAS